MHSTGLNHENLYLALVARHAAIEDGSRSPNVETAKTAATEDFKKLVGVEPPPKVLEAIASWKSEDCNSNAQNSLRLVASRRTLTPQQLLDLIEKDLGDSLGEIDLVDPEGGVAIRYLMQTESEAMSAARADIVRRIFKGTKDAIGKQGKEWADVFPVWGAGHGLAWLIWSGFGGLTLHSAHLLHRSVRGARATEVIDANELAPISDRFFAPDTPPIARALIARVCDALSRGRELPSGSQEKWHLTNDADAALRKILAEAAKLPSDVRRTGERLLQGTFACTRAMGADFRQGLTYLRKVAKNMLPRERALLRGAMREIGKGLGAKSRDFLIQAAVCEPTTESNRSALYAEFELYRRRSMIGMRRDICSAQVESMATQLQLLPTTERLAAQVHLMGQAFERDGTAKIGFSGTAKGELHNLLTTAI